MVEFDKYGFKQIIPSEREKYPNNGLWYNEYARIYVWCLGNVCDISTYTPVDVILHKLIIRNNKDFEFFINHVGYLKSRILDEFYTEDYEPEDYNVT